MNEFWDYQIWNNAIRDWAVALGIIAASLVVLRIFRTIIIKRILAFTASTKTTLDDFIIATIQSSVMPLLYVLAIYFGLRYLQLTPRALRIEQIMMMFLICFFLIRMILAFIGYTFQQALSKRGKNVQRERQAKGILFIIQAGIWLIGLLFLIDNLGYDITTLVAGLGIGGIAIALAAQTVLGDLFSYLVIFFDKPFEIGDFIIVEDKLGTVEYIGIKTTRIRTLGGEQLVMSNTDLTNSRVHNYKRMEERRVVFSFRVQYDTPAPKLKIIPPLVKKIIEGMEATRFDRAHFQSFGEYSLDFEVVYYVLSADYNIYMDKQQEINLKIFELFTQEAIQFALPKQRVVVEGAEVIDNRS